jgi:hypothetical protein
MVKVMVTRILCTLQLFSEVGVISESKGLHRKLYSGNGRELR